MANHSKSEAILHCESEPLERPLPAKQDRRATHEFGNAASRRAIATWIASGFGHLALLLTLTLFVVAGPEIDRTLLTLSLPDNAAAMDETLDAFVDVEAPDIESEPNGEAIEIERLLQDLTTRQVELPINTDSIIASVMQTEPLAVTWESQVLARKLPTRPQVEFAGGNDASGVPGGPGDERSVNADGELGGRALRRIEFSTTEADYAINRGLDWLARHQFADGGWGFEHRVGDCRGRCPHPGSKRGARVAATGLALLPFLGSGHSPEHGEYRTTVAAGINYLIDNTSRHGSLWRPEGEMYGHGIATLALCECYGIMSQAPRGPEYDTSIPVDVEQLRRAATSAIAFIVDAQAVDGGWRYMPRQLGDTSVVGWQIMALKSAKDAGLGTNQRTINAAHLFLNSVQVASEGDPQYGMVGTIYAYQPNKRKVSNATTAIGLACRIYMGTSPLNPGMETAVKRIAARGPVHGNMYYNLYANQVVFQHGGAEWESWNQQLNEQLTESQSVRGHMEGSWFFGNGDHGAKAGGRLYATAMACLCLEESFRHLPIFRKNPRLRLVEGLSATIDEEVEPNERIVTIADRN